MTKDEEIDFLKERVAQLEGLLADDSIIPIQFGLSANQAKLFGLLLRRDQITINQGMDFLYGGQLGDAPDRQVVAVMVSHMRKKLKPFGVDIKVVWGSGYRLTPETKAKVASYLAKPRVAA